MGLSGASFESPAGRRTAGMTTLTEFPATLERHLAELIVSRTCLLQEVEAADPDSAAAGSEPGRWSAAEVVYHLHLSEATIVRMLRKALASVERHPAADEARLRAEWERIRYLVGTRVARVKAPPRTVPADPPGLTQAVEALNQSRRDLLETVKDAPYEDLLSISMPHPFDALGPLTGASWLSVVAFHDLRHADQIREMRAGLRS